MRRNARILFAALMLITPAGLLTGTGAAQAATTPHKPAVHKIHRPVVHARHTAVRTHHVVAHPKKPG